MFALDGHQHAPLICYCGICLWDTIDLTTVSCQEGARSHDRPPAAERHRRVAARVPLHDGPMTGYELAATAQRVIGDFWSLTQSQVYRELAWMAEAGTRHGG